MPPTAQVGGAVIKGPRLPLPPIQIPNTAPPMMVTTPSKKTHILENIDDLNKNEVDNTLQNQISEESMDKGNEAVNSSLQEHTCMQSIDIEMNITLQSYSNPLFDDLSFDDTGVSEIKHENTNIDSGADVNADSTLTENLVSSSSTLKAIKNVSTPPLETVSYRQKFEPIKNPIATKSPKKPLQHKKKALFNTLSASHAPSLGCSSKNDGSSNNRLTAEYLHNGGNDKILPALKGKNAKLPPKFDVVTSLTGEKR